MVDVTGDAAVAKVVLDYPSARFTDYMSLLKIGGEWRDDVAGFAQRAVDLGLTPGVGIAVTQDDWVLWSGGFGVPCTTLQYPHDRVQVSPRIMNVAVPWCQHSPMFGQFASSQTVWRPRVRIKLLSRW